MARDLCDICRTAPATTSDGIVGARLCDSATCLDLAWDRAFSQPSPCPNCPTDAEIDAAIAANYRPAKPKGDTDA